MSFFSAQQRQPCGNHGKRQLHMGHRSSTLRLQHQPQGQEGELRRHRRSRGSRKVLASVGPHLGHGEDRWLRQCGRQLRLPTTTGMVCNFI
jgi:hypothetical protein